MQAIDYAEYHYIKQGFNVVYATKIFVQFQEAGYLTTTSSAGNSVSSVSSTGMATTSAYFSIKFSSFIGHQQCKEVLQGSFVCQV